MSNMINSLPRFGYEHTNGVDRVFDYATSRYTTVKDDETIIESTDGVWNGRKLIDLIKTGQQIDSARQADAGDRAVPDENEDPEAFANRRRIEQLRQDEDERMAREQAQAGQPDKVEQFSKDFLESGSSQQEHDINKTSNAVRVGAGEQAAIQKQGELEQQPGRTEPASREEGHKKAEEDALQLQQAQSQNETGTGLQQPGQEVGADGLTEEQRKRQQEQEAQGQSQG